MDVSFGGHRYCSFVVPAGTVATDIVVNVYTGSSSVANAALTAAAQGSMRNSNDTPGIVNFDYSVVGVAGNTGLREEIRSASGAFDPIVKNFSVGPEYREIQMPNGQASTSGTCGCSSAGRLIG